VPAIHTAVNFYNTGIVTAIEGLGPGANPTTSEFATMLSASVVIG
jgi:hypothetical protein